MVLTFKGDVMRSEKEFFDDIRKLQLEIKKKKETQDQYYIEIKSINDNLHVKNYNQIQQDYLMAKKDWEQVKEDIKP